VGAENPVLALLNERYLLDYPHEAARALEAQSEDAAVKSLLARSPAAQLQAWQVLSPDLAARLLAALPAPAACDLLTAADPQVGIAALAHLEPPRRDALLAALQESVAQELRLLMAYPAHTVGHIMDPRISALRNDLSVGEAIERLRSLRQRGLRELFVVDDQMQLIGQIEMEDLVLSGRERPLREITRGLTAVLRDTDPAAQVATTLQTHPLNVLPVVTEQGRFVGVVRQVGLLAAIRHDSSVALQTMVGAGADERALSSPGFAVGKRLPWLQLNLLSVFLAAAVVGLFESTLAQFTVLAVLLPVVAGQSGIAGAQALAVTVRARLLREVHLSQWPRIAMKEAAAGLFNGVAVAVIAALGVYLWSRSLGLALIIALAMVIAMVAAGLAGALVPLLLRQQSATGAAVIVRTVTDVVGFFAFLGVATALRGMLQPLT
jgi:magnesium transporter